MDLFRAGILRGERAKTCASGHGCGHQIHGTHELGDAKIQQLGFALRGHQDVRGLCVEVQDQVSVCVLHRIANGTE